MRPSKQLIDTFAYAQKSEEWILSEDLAANCEMSSGTARTHLKRLTEAQVLVVQKMYPAYRYKLAGGWEKTELAQFLAQFA